MVTCSPGSKPLPLTLTKLPDGPEAGEIVSTSDSCCPATPPPVAEPVLDVDVVAPEVAPATVKVASILTVNVSLPCIA
jgi:hypothetical protein